MDFIGHGLIQVKLIDDPAYKVKSDLSEEKLLDIGSAIQFTKNFFEQEKEHERIIYMTVEEWKKHGYNLASPVVLDISPRES
jgi:hypothetical protein